MTEPDERDTRPARIVRRNPTAVTAKLCPRCLNPMRPDSSLLGYLVPQNYICTKCGYRGPVFIESDQSVVRSEKKE